MTSEFRVIVLIGQVASGKTAVAREFVRQRTVRVTGIEQLQAVRSDTSPAGIARELRALTGSGTVVYECSGAHPDFEETLFEIEANGAVPFVVLLEASFETASRRLQERGQREPPRGGGSWSDHLQWVQTRLRLVPVDVCVSTEHDGPSKAVGQILRAFENRPQGQSVRAVSLAFRALRRTKSARCRTVSSTSRGVKRSSSPRRFRWASTCTLLLRDSTNPRRLR